MDSGPARFFAPYAHVVFDFWEEYVEISLLDDLGGEVKRSGEMSVVITTHCAWLRRAAVAAATAARRHGRRTSFAPTTRRRRRRGEIFCDCL